MNPLTFFVTSKVFLETLQENPYLKFIKCSKVIQNLINCIKGKTSRRSRHKKEKKKKIGFAVPSKLYEYCFLKTYRRIAVNQYDFVLPENKMPTESWSLHELKLTFDKNFPPKNSTFLLLTYDIPNIKSKTDNIT